MLHVESKPLLPLGSESVEQNTRGMIRRGIMVVSIGALLTFGAFAVLNSMDVHTHTASLAAMTSSMANSMATRGYQRTRETRPSTHKLPLPSLRAPHQMSPSNGVGHAQRGARTQTLQPVAAVGNSDAVPSDVPVVPDVPVESLTAGDPVSMVAMAAVGCILGFLFWVYRRAQYARALKPLPPVAMMGTSAKEVVLDEEGLRRVMAKEEQEQSWWQKLVTRSGRLLAMGTLCLALAFAVPGFANAANSSGRVGGSNFGAARAGAASSSSYSSSIGGSVGPSSRGYAGYTAPGVATSSTTVIVAPTPTYTYMPSYGYPVTPVYSTGGPGIIGILFMGLACFILVNAFLNASSDEEGVMGGPCTVVKVQVGLLGLARNLQKDLDQLARRADTSGPEGLHYVLQETVVSLMRNPDYCVYGASETVRANGLDEAENKFNEQSMTERSKFKGETLTNYAGNAGSKASGTAKSDISNELIVVTLLVAVDGRLQLPNISSLQDLKDALSKLGSVTTDGLLALEVLWTPQEDGDTFTQEEMITDYPSLINL